MMRQIKLLAGVLLAATLVACGGGGGSAGVTTGSNGTSNTKTGTPTLTLSLVDAAGTAVSGNTVTPGSTVYAQAVVKDAAGAAVANKLVALTTANGLLTFQPTSGQVLTDSTGTARVQVSPATSTTSGADSITANTTVDTTTLTSKVDIQTTPANVALKNFTPATSTLTAFQATSVSVDVTVNGAVASATPVTVNFAANCGAFTPTSSATNSSGKALSTFTATGCTGGTATLTASSIGATPVQANVQVESPQPTNLLFVSATPATIFTSSASSGVKQSTVIFKVVDASGNGIAASTQVQVSLASSAIAAGVTFADTGTTAPKVLSTDATGQISVIVKSGGVPTPLTVNAVLVNNSNITAASAGLSVNSGRAVQNFFSLSVQPFNPEGWSYDGELSSLTIRAADRLAQPVPAGTPVSFIAEGGQITASCQLAIDASNKSGCSVSLATQAFRPSNGRVTVLSYMDGEEVFVDANGNNKYDAGETFYDMGQPFLDSNENSTLDTGEQKVGDPSVAGAGIGSVACTAHPYLVANVANTCDGVWGGTRVRAQAVIVFSTSFAGVSTVSNSSASGFDILIPDQNGNAMPFNTTVTATLSGGKNCSVVSVIPSTVASTTNPTTHHVVTKAGSDPGDTCSGAQVTVSTTTPKNNTTVLGNVAIP